MIDISFDFTTDTPRGKDPDAASPALREYHRLLWSKELPNGEVMELRKVPDSEGYLAWNGFYLSSDSIIVELWHSRNKRIINQVKEILPDPDTYFNSHLHRSYTMGGMILFPMHRNSMNQMRGMNSLISDRWDLTMECIRRYYSGIESPLSKTIEGDSEFFDLFVDFKGYVDFFLLQDCVSDDYSSVDIWCGDSSFETSGLPKTTDEYFTFIEKEHAFLDKRNMRIAEYCKEKGL